MSNETEDQQPPKDFAAVLLELDKGRAHTDLSHALREVAHMATETGKVGKVQLTLSVKPQANSADEVLLVAYAIKTTVPEFDRPESVFYATDGGDLVRANPNQRTIFDQEQETTK